MPQIHEPLKPDSQIQLTKLDAALRQLAGGIRLLFSGEDVVLVHSLVGAASVVLGDLVKHRFPDRSWDKQAQDATDMSAKEYFAVMRKVQNFLKHADNDPDGEILFDFVDTEAITFWAVMNSSELGPMSPEAQVFQLWYLASHTPRQVDQENKSIGEVIKLFGDLRDMSRLERLAYGAKVLRENFLSPIQENNFGMTNS